MHRTAATEQHRNEVQEKEKGKDEEKEKEKENEKGKGKTTAFAVVRSSYLNAVHAWTRLLGIGKQREKGRRGDGAEGAEGAEGRSLALQSNSNRIRTLCAAQLAFFAALAGAQSTVLPLFLARDFSMGPAELGGVFAGMAAVGVFSAQPLATIADRFGRDKVGLVLWFFVSPAASFCLPSAGPPAANPPAPTILSPPPPPPPAPPPPPRWSFLSLWIIHSLCVNVNNTNQPSSID